MASAAMLRSPARSPRLRQTLEPQWCLLAMRLLSSSSSGSGSSVPAERHNSPPSSNKPLKGSMDKGVMQHKSQPYPENIYKLLLVKVDKISEGVDEHTRLIKELEAELREKNKNAEAIDLTPWVASISSCLLFFGLYKYV